MKSAAPLLMALAITFSFFSLALANPHLLKAVAPNTSIAEAARDLQSISDSTHMKPGIAVIEIDAADADDNANVTGDLPIQARDQPGPPSIKIFKHRNTDRGWVYANVAEHECYRLQQATATVAAVECAGRDAFCKFYRDPNCKSFAGDLKQGEKHECNTGTGQDCDWSVRCSMHCQCRPGFGFGKTEICVSRRCLKWNFPNVI